MLAPERVAPDAVAEALPLRILADRVIPVTAADALRRMAGQLDRMPVNPSHDAVRDLLVDWGEIEAAAADAFSPEVDEEHPGLGAWRAASDAIAEGLCASWDGDSAGCRGSLDSARMRIDRLSCTPGPETLPTRTARGFAYDAVTPEQYIAAARALARDRSLGAVMCLGLRTIGSILAHVVAASLRRRGVPASVRSLRPRGEPFDRRIEIGGALRATLATCGASCFAIVDEGPGSSGTSFASVVDLLGTIGVGAGRVVLFPSRETTEDALQSARGRSVWSRHSKTMTTFDDVWMRSGRLFGPGAIEDLSAGAWRRLHSASAFLRGSPEPPVQPQHERRKYLRRNDTVSIARFAGFGRRGVAIQERALRLHDAGFGAKPRGLTHGFLEQDWIHGRPPMASATGLLNRIADYLSFVGREFVTSEPESIDELHETVVTNARSIAGVDLAVADALARQARGCEAPRVQVDGRMLPYEWIQSDERLMKVDALDHHDDGFWPGCRDIGWDIAGAIMEFDFDRAQASYLVRRYRRLSGDRGISLRMPLVEAAYLAYRFGYASVAADALGHSPDGRGFGTLRERYRRSLVERLGVT
jgi:hypothetical protein